MEMVEFLSPEWVQLFRSIIQEGLSPDDLKGVEFSMYEVYKNVAPHLRRGGSPDFCFGFRISGGRLEFFDQPIRDATIRVVGDYEAMAPWVALPLEQTRELKVVERMAAAGKIKIEGDLANRPEFMERLNLHDRLGERTKWHVAPCNL